MKFWFHWRRTRIMKMVFIKRLKIDQYEMLLINKIFLEKLNEGIVELGKDIGIRFLNGSTFKFWWLHLKCTHICCTYFVGILIVFTMYVVWLGKDTGIRSCKDVLKEHPPLARLLAPTAFRQFAPARESTFSL